MTLFSRSPGRPYRFVYLTVLLQFFCLISVMITGCTTQDSLTVPGKAPRIPLDAAVALYSAHCASYHGKSGKGGVGPDLTVSKYRYGKKMQQVVKSIMYGRENGMPAFNPHLSQAQAEAIALYILELK